MRRLIRKRVLLIGATVVVAIGVGAGYAAAVITSATPQLIQACSLKAVGTLRVVSSPTQCTKLETPIGWNAQGPPGDKGDPGVGTAYVFNGGPTNLINGDGLTLAGTMPLPAGNYVVSAKVVVDVTNSTPVSRVACYLDGSSNRQVFGGIDNSTVSVIGDTNEVLTVQGALTLTTAGGVDLKCFATRGDATLYQPAITALPVANLVTSN